LGNVVIGEIKGNNGRRRIERGRALRRATSRCGQRGSGRDARRAGIRWFSNRANRRRQRVLFDTVRADQRRTVPIGRDKQT
jgi:hypothetical protein